MPTIIPDFSKIVIPDASGTPMYMYKVKDAEARAALSGGMKYIFAWKGTETPNVSKIPNTVTVLYNGVPYTGTLTAEAAHNGTNDTAGVPFGFWLVNNGENGYSEYVPIEDDTVTPSTWRWEKFGDLALSLSDLGALAYADIVELEKGNGVDVIGKDATLVAQPSAVTFASQNTDDVLGANTTFTVTGPTITDNSTPQSLSVVMGPVTVPDTSNTAAVVTGLDNNETKKTDVLTANSLTTRQVKTASIRGVKTALGTTTGSTGKVTKKLGKKQIQEAELLNIVGSNLVTPTTKKLVSKTIKVPSGTDTVDGIDVITKKKLETGTFREVSEASNSPSTITGLSIKKYNEYYAETENTIEGADNETLVISFSTTPTLLLANNATGFATGSLVASNDQNYASLTGGEIVSNITTTNKNIVTGIGTDTVAGATLADTGQGEDIVVSVDTTGNIIAAKLKSNKTWVGTGETVDESQTGDSAGSSVITSVNSNVSVNVPELDNNSVTVMTDSTTDSGGITLVSGTNNRNDASVYTNIGFTTDNVLKGTTSQTPTAQLKLDNGTAANSVSVITAGGVSVTGDYDVTVGSNDPVTAITDIGTATAAAQIVGFDDKNLQKVALYNELKIKTESHPANRYLNFLTPVSGTIYLHRRGNAYSRNFEISFDGVNWQSWTFDSENSCFSMPVAAGDRLYIRATSETPVPLSSGEENYYQFAVPNGTEVNGIVESLLCKTPEFGEIGNLSNNGYHFANLFRDCRIKGRPIINSKTVKTRSLQYMFRNTTIQEIELHTVSRNGDYAFEGWLLYGASSGTIYLPNTLSMSNNSVSGIPTGWSTVYL